MSPAQFNEYQRQADVIEQHQKLQKEKELSNILNNMTAIDWLVEKVNSDCLNSTFIRKELIDEAKEIEYKQTMDAMQKGMELQEKENNRIGFRERNGLLSSQTEISDEEIKAFAMGYYDNNGADYYVDLGAKWYREQLKKKQ